MVYNINPTEIVKNIEHFRKSGQHELGLNWSQVVILSHLADDNVTFLSTSEIITATEMDRCWVYRNLKQLRSKHLVDCAAQARCASHKARVIYSINGKGTFYLTQLFVPNGVNTIKAFERQ
jgi:hypothetical protein